MSWCQTPQYPHQQLCGATPQGVNAGDTRGLQTLGGFKEIMVLKLWLIGALLHNITIYCVSALSSLIHVGFLCLAEFFFQSCIVFCTAPKFTRIDFSDPASNLKKFVTLHRLIFCPIACLVEGYDEI